MTRTRPLCLVLALALCVVAAASAEQMFPAKPGGDGLSAYPVASTSGLEPIPAGWTRETGRDFTNCMLAHEDLVPGPGAGVLVTESYPLPEARCGGTSSWTSAPSAWPTGRRT